MAKKEAKSKQSINYQFKILYAIGIIFVVISHIKGNNTLRFLNDWFAYGPFMLALFVFCSGYFYKDKNEKRPFQYIYKKIKHLIIPLLLWNFFYAGIILLLSTKNFTIGREVTIENLLLTPFRDGHQFAYNLGSWFIAPLFFIEVLNLLLRLTPIKKLKPLPKNLILLLISFILGTIGVHLASEGMTEGWLLPLTRTCFLFPFFEIGVIYKNHLEKNDLLPNPIYFLIIIISAITINTICGRIPDYTTSWMSNFNDGTLLPYLSALVPLAFWLRVSRILTPVIGHSRTINTIADNTYTIMVNHLMGFMIVKTFFAILSKIIILDPSFNWASYKKSIWYIYYPFNNKNFSILYLIAGIVIPILMQKVAHKLFILIKNNATKRNAVKPSS